MNFREAEIKDKEFILNANKEINVLSGLNDSTFEKEQIKIYLKIEFANQLLLKLAETLQE